MIRPWRVIPAPGDSTSKRTAGREHFDEQHAGRYDAKEDADPAEEVSLLQAAGVLGPAARVVELGTGSGRFALAAARVCEAVVAVDVSPVMLARLVERLGDGAAGEVEAVHAGFLTYRHTGRPADLVYSRYVLHHLPDFWKALALRRMAAMLRPGGVLRLWDVVYGFEPAEAEQRIEAWITKTHEHGRRARVDPGGARGARPRRALDVHLTARAHDGARRPRHHGRELQRIGRVRPLPLHEAVSGRAGGRAACDSPPGRRRRPPALRRERL